LDGSSILPGSTKINKLRICAVKIKPANPLFAGFFDFREKEGYPTFASPMEYYLNIVQAVRCQANQVFNFL